MVIDPPSLPPHLPSLLRKVAGRPFTEVSDHGTLRAVPTEAQDRWALESRVHPDDYRLRMPDATSLSPHVSGGARSSIDYGSLDFQTQRVVSTVNPKERIDRVMGETGVAKDPIRVMVGKGHGVLPKSAARVAFEELKQLGAFDRKVLVVASPIANGAVNRVFLSALEYLTRGDVAFAAIQTSRGAAVPSYPWLPRASRAHLALLKMVNAELRARTARGESVPRVVGYGESYGAWASQRAFMLPWNRRSMLGERGAAHMDNALWFGSPGASGLPGLAMRSENPVYLRTNDPAEVAAHPEARFLFIKNPDDDVANFGPSLALRRPKDWPKNEPYHRIRSLVKAAQDMPEVINFDPMRYAPDGAGHDYRGLIARTLGAVDWTDATPEQIQDVELQVAHEEWLRGSEIVAGRAQRAAEKAKK